MATVFSSSSKWIVLPSCGSSEIELNQLLKINDLEFGRYHKESKCIQKYNIIDNKWTNWIKMNDFFIGMTTAFALNQSKLYVYTNKQLIVMNTKQNSHKIYDCNAYADLPYADLPATIIINNKLHFVAGFRNKHLIWNEQQSQFDVKHTFEFNSLYFHRLIHLKSKNILLSIGGSHGGRRTDAIYSFDITLNKWS
eukprot:104872_1